jgi:hypothetical protein
MEAICTASTASGKKCKRCVEKHGDEYCWQHSERVTKTPKRSSPKKPSPKRGSPIKMSPKKEAFELENLPKEVLYDVLLRLPYERLNSVCRANKKIAKICIEKRFQEEYKAKHPEHKTMLIGPLGPKKELFGSDDVHVHYDSINNRIVVFTRNDQLSRISYTPSIQNYGIKIPKDYGSLQIVAVKDKDNWKMVIQRGLKKDTDIAYTADNAMIEIKNFLKSIGKERWQPKKARVRNYGTEFKSSPQSANEFVTIIENELAKINK